MSSDALREVEQEARKLIRELALLRQREREAERASEALERERLLAQIEIVDAFERVFKSIEAKPELVTDQMKIWIGNFRAVKRLVERQLAERGARPFAAGHSFDPHRHTIQETVADPARAEGEVVEQIRPGYERNGEVLRKAELRVVKNLD